MHDHYGQTELGMVICDAWRDDIAGEVPVGSMGRALPGWSCAVLANGTDVEAPAGEMGRVAIDTRNSPLLWFRGYLDAPEKTAQRYTPDGTWYLTGDAGARDDAGCYLFSARDDDVIIMAGYRIGPFEVESVLSRTLPVTECAVVAAPDEVRGEVLEAYVLAARTATGHRRELATNSSNE